jgi:hypothetical protein
MADRAQQARRPRDGRLDFFRGLCLLIIFVAHIVDNAWARWIPAKFGFSDATEIFVFCSGMASAVAFGGAYRVHGWLMGTARVLFRCWQVYWAHIGVLLVTIALMVAVDGWLKTGGRYVDGLKFRPLFEHTAGDAIVGMLTLRWVPNYFDILPMYLVVLTMLPLVVALYGLGRNYAFAFVGLVWLAGTLRLIELPAEPWGTREWFFNPFAWQLVFFTGFALMSGWLPAPPTRRWLVRAAIGILILTIPLAWAPLYDNVRFLGAARDTMHPLISKTEFGILRYAHFLALAYLAYVAAGEKGSRLTGATARVIAKTGQQSLAIFMTGLVLAFAASAALNVMGRTVLTVPLVNIAGIAILIGVARITAFFKAEPWTRPAPPKPDPVPAVQSGRGLLPAE